MEELYRHHETSMYEQERNRQVSEPVEVLQRDFNNEILEDSDPVLSSSSLKDLTQITLESPS